MFRLRATAPLAVSVICLTATGLAGAAAASATESRPDALRHGSAPNVGSFAVVGDLPYGNPAIAALPDWIADINADPDVSSVAHLGDIKSGSSRCDDSYFDFIRTSFDQFADPLIYTPGDNEWTDCHRANNGGYDPLERLEAIRARFFQQPFRSLGQRSMPVWSQAFIGLPENVRYERYGLSFASLHVVGSNNDLAPWNGTDASITEPNARQIAEERRRMQGTIANLRLAFAKAKLHRDRAVVLFMQADMFDDTYTADPADYTAFTPLVQALVDESSRYGGEVYLFNGDSHTFRSDSPLEAGSSWLDFYGVRGAADNLTRVVVDGSSAASKGYLKVSVAPRKSAGPVLSWTEVPYATQP